MSRNLLSEYASIKAYSSIGIFANLDTVTINVYKNGSLEPLDSAACVEISATGIFTWSFANLTTAPDDLSEYYWIMSDTTTKEESSRELVYFGGWVENVNLLGPADTCKITVNLSESDGIGAIDIDTLMTDNNGNTMEIAATYFANDSYFKVGEKMKPSYDFLSNSAYWIFPQGASVNIDLQTFKVTEKAKTVPAQDEISLNDWLNL